MYCLLQLVTIFLLIWLPAAKVGYHWSYHYGYQISFVNVSGGDPKKDTSKNFVKVWRNIKKILTIFVFKSGSTIPNTVLTILKVYWFVAIKKR